MSPFSERHSAWHFNIGFNEIYNTGRSGQERADEICPIVLDWLKRNDDRDNWFMHVNFWDPHTPYRTPEDYGNPFADDPPPDWLTDEIRQNHFERYGSHSAQEPWGYEPYTNPERYPRVPESIGSMANYRKWIDGYDVGIRCVDDHVGKILDELEAQGILEETAIIVSADHGENQGELNVYGDHQTADNITCSIPLIVKWPGMVSGTIREGLCYNVDLAATVTELSGGEIHEALDGESFTKALGGAAWQGRDSIVFSQCAWACQRGVRFGPWMLIRTYHDGLKAFPEVMLYNVTEDPHETKDLSTERPEIVNEGIAILEKWQADNLASSALGEDPMWTVMHEGGPLHTRSSVKQYCEWLRATHRGHHAESIEEKHGTQNR